MCAAPSEPIASAPRAEFDFARRPSGAARVSRAEYSRNMIEFVMFDADGVLFDSTESNVAYYNWIFAKVGEPPLDPDEEISAISYAAAEVFAARARGDAAKLAAMHAVTRNMDQTPFFKMLRPSLELHPFMLELKLHYKLGLATNRSATV